MADEEPRFREIKDMEKEFFGTELRDTHSAEEIQELYNASHYGHDLSHAISRGYRRKFDTAMNEADKWLSKIVAGVAKPNSERLFWHMLCRVVDRAKKSGVKQDAIRVMIQRLLEVETRREERDAR